MGHALGLAELRPDDLPRAEPIAPESGEAVRRRMAGRIDGFARAFNAHERAQSPDVYWRNLRQALEKRFQVPFEIRDQGGGGAARGLGALAQQYQRDAAGYGKSGNPFAGDPAAPGAPRSLAGDAAAAGLEQRGIGPAAELATSMTMRQWAAANTNRLVTHVLISQTDDDALSEVTLIDPSGNGAYDRLALSQARGLLGKELEQLGPLPREGRRTLWAFETEFTVLPPLPIMGCGLDAYFVPRDCAYPMKKTARSRVRLEAIY